MRKPLALIVEDEPMIVVDIEASLKQAGFAVASEPSCVRARQILALVQPDVVILDVLLQDGVSSSVAEELVARNIPFVVYSATDIEDRGEAFKAGTFVEKPADDSVLVALASSMARHPTAGEHASIWLKPRQVGTM
ncbi:MULTISPECIES: response regulator [Mesorhizobium]|uniref:response regulator n=1 Tax=Mesorhizobium sp. TaxID=1871066 RepID=UPI000B0B557B|nr:MULTISPECIES: response regulator [Mesorhizobium]RWM69181.1 MAG: response regulator [Mesorhizobium sp.]TIO20872.1 MAG: response regulator [Mesorhizobium sp.]TJV55109.1 MAG: response regulator [Mesorhizobium sp.]